MRYSRASAALIMHAGFLWYVGVLIYKIATEDPLLEMSFENFEESTELPVIDIYPSNPSFRLTGCSYDTGQAINIEISDYQNYMHNDSDIYSFNTNNKFNIALKNNEKLELPIAYTFYWEFNATEHPAESDGYFPFVEIHLYDYSVQETLSNAKTADHETIVNKIIYEDWIPVYSSTNHFTFVSFVYEEYVAIRSKSISSFAGFSTSPVHIITAPATYHSVPIIMNGTSEIYEGAFEISLQGNQKMITTEVRKNNVIEAIALAGGWYGILVSVYLFFFGMYRTSPWGVFHFFPIFFKKSISATDTETIVGDANSEIRNKVDRLEALLEMYFLNMKYTHSFTNQGSTDIEKSCITEVNTIPSK